MITIRMPRQDLADWLAALRAPQNQNKQGKGILFDAGSYCCLGVAQVVKTGGKIEAYPALDNIVRFRKTPTYEWLRSVGWEWTNANGALTNNPYLPILECSAIMANDCQGHSFSEIADAIEACSKGY